jgi:dTDP-4-amino-4,6-dideoxygalactose transaminase
MQNVPLLDLKGQYAAIKTEIDTAIKEVAESQHFVLGPTVERFEKAIAQYIDVKHAIGVASGSDALLLALMAFDIKEGDEVITSPFTFFATAGSIARTGARPVFVDIEPDTFNIDVNKIAAYLAKSGKSVKAIMPVHIFGQCTDMGPIMDLAKRYKIAVIEDAAQAIGSIYQKHKAGTLGHIGCFSFFPSKNLGGWGDGGLVTTNDDTMDQKIKSLRVHGGTNKKYHHQYIGCNSRLDALQAAILTAKLKHLDEWTQARQANAQRYQQLIQTAGLANKAIPPITRPDRNHIFHQYTIRVPKQRDELKAFLQKQGIGTEVYYPLSLHMQECFTYLGYKPGSLPESEKAEREVLSLPIYPELTASMQEYVVEQIKLFFK